MKQIVVIAYNMRTAASYARQLVSLLGEQEVPAEAYAMERGLPSRISADAVLLSAHFIYTLLEDRLRECRHVIVADITLPAKALDCLREMPSGTRAMLVNTTMEMAVETINLIRNAGIYHIELVPVYPGMEEIPPLSLAVTPGERGLVPAQATEVIDLQDRVLSAGTITNLAAKLELTRRLRSSKVQTYFDSLIRSDWGIEQLLSRVSEQERKLDLLMQVFEGGIITFARDGRVEFLNPAARQLLGNRVQSAVGSQVEELLPELETLQMLHLKEPIRDQVMTVGGQLMDISVYPLAGSLDREEYVLMMRTMEEVERNSFQIRRQVMKKGHVAKHNFSHIRTQNPKMQQLKETAWRMAASSSSIVIYGKSGTGKELFAQSIHNASPRRNYPFIAINCASIPENLLESELFGYSEGAFTGAKKGGKRGYFELAHKGTLFLDEIGEMDLGLQARILRVLQEKEVTRVGGDSVISVDVRILSASNKRLLDLVRQGWFREDLYYRLNVLSIEIPPLRERREDVPLLIRDFQNQLQTEFTLTQEAQAFLAGYPWPGNVRELGNFVERLSYLGKAVMGLEDVRSQLDEQPESPAAAKDWWGEQFLAQQEQLEVYGVLLSLLQANRERGVHQGRGGLSRELAKQGHFLSEQQVRACLGTLRRYGLVTIYAGRRGTEITEEGRQVLREIGSKTGYNIT